MDSYELFAEDVGAGMLDGLPDLGTDSFDPTPGIPPPQPPQQPNVQGNVTVVVPSGPRSNQPPPYGQIEHLPNLTQDNSLQKLANFGDYGGHHRPSPQQHHMDGQSGMYGSPAAQINHHHHQQQHLAGGGYDASGSMMGGGPASTGPMCGPVTFQNPGTSGSGGTMRANQFPSFCPTNESGIYGLDQGNMVGRSEPGGGVVDVGGGSTNDGMRGGGGWNGSTSQSYPVGGGNTYGAQMGSQQDHYRQQMGAYTQQRQPEGQDMGGYCAQDSMMTGGPGVGLSRGYAPMQQRMPAFNEVGGPTENPCGNTGVYPGQGVNVNSGNMAQQQVNQGYVNYGQTHHHMQYQSQQPGGNCDMGVVNQQPTPYNHVQMPPQQHVPQVIGGTAHHHSFVSHRMQVPPVSNHRPHYVGQQHPMPPQQQKVQQMSSTTGGGSPQYRTSFPQLSPQMSPRNAAIQQRVGSPGPRMSPRPPQLAQQQLMQMSPVKPCLSPHPGQTTMSPRPPAALTPKASPSAVYPQVNPVVGQSSPVPPMPQQSTLQRLEQMVGPPSSSDYPQTRYMPEGINSMGNTALGVPPHPNTSHNLAPQRVHSSLPTSSPLPAQPVQWGSNAHVPSQAMGMGMTGSSVPGPESVPHQQLTGSSVSGDPRMAQPLSANNSAPPLVGDENSNNRIPGMGNLAPVDPSCNLPGSPRIIPGPEDVSLVNPILPDADQSLSMPEFPPVSVFKASEIVPVEQSGSEPSVVRQGPSMGTEARDPSAAGNYVGSYDAAGGDGSLVQVPSTPVSMPCPGSRFPGPVASVGSYGPSGAAEPVTSTLPECPPGAVSTAVPSTPQLPTSTASVDKQTELTPTPTSFTHAGEGQIPPAPPACPLPSGVIAPHGGMPLPFDHHQEISNLELQLRELFCMPAQQPMPEVQEKVVRIRERQSILQQHIATEHCTGGPQCILGPPPGILGLTPDSLDAQVGGPGKGRAKAAGPPKPKKARKKKDENQTPAEPVIGPDGQPLPPPEPKPKKPKTPRKPREPKKPKEPKPPKEPKEPKEPKKKREPKPPGEGKPAKPRKSRSKKKEAPGAAAAADGTAATPAAADGTATPGTPPAEPKPEGEGGTETTTKEGESTTPEVKTETGAEGEAAAPTTTEGTPATEKTEGGEEGTPATSTPAPSKTPSKKSSSKRDRKGRSPRLSTTPKLRNAKGMFSSFKKKSKNKNGESEVSDLDVTPPPSPEAEADNGVQKRRSARNTHRKKYVDDIELAISEDELHSLLPLTLASAGASLGPLGEVSLAGSPPRGEAGGVSGGSVEGSGGKVTAAAVPSEPSKRRRNPASAVTPAGGEDEGEGVVKPNFVYINTTDEDSMIVQHVLAVRMGKREIRKILNKKEPVVSKSEDINAEEGEAETKEGVKDEDVAKTAGEDKLEEGKKNESVEEGVVIMQEKGEGKSSAEVIEEGKDAEGKESDSEDTQLKETEEGKALVEDKEGHEGRGGGEDDDMESLEKVQDVEVKAASDSMECTEIETNGAVPSTIEGSSKMDTSDSNVESDVQKVEPVVQDAPDSLDTSEDQPLNKTEEENGSAMEVDQVKEETPINSDVVEVKQNAQEVSEEISEMVKDVDAKEDSVEDGEKGSEIKEAGVNGSDTTKGEKLESDSAVKESDDTKNSEEEGVKEEAGEEGKEESAGKEESKVEAETEDEEEDVVVEVVEVEEYFVKYRSFSYLHCDWKTEEELMKGDKRIAAKIKRFKQKMGQTANIFENLEDEPFNPDYVEVDRVLDAADHKDPNTGKTTKNYLVKWKGLQYEDATWELEEDLDPVKIKQFEAFRELPPKDQWKPKKKPTGEQWEKLDVSPVYKNENTLRAYQLEGLNWLLFSWYNGRNCILADEMGLGKTIQSIAFINAVYQSGIKRPFLVVAPLSTIPNWQREFEAWTDMNVIVYHGSTASRNMLQEYEMFYRDEKGNPLKELPKFNVLITTFEIIIADCMELREFTWRLCVIDEAHRLKNRNCKLLEGLRLLNLEHRVLLSGTPLQNNVNELFSLLNFLEPSQFGSSESFLQEFGALKSETEVQKLQALLKPMMLRRLKEDVEKTIAPKEETVIEVELTNIQKKYYRAILERNFSFLSKGTTTANVPNLMNTMMELRKCCIHPYLLNGAEEQIQLEYRQAHGEDPDAYFKALIKSSGKMVLIDKLLPKLKDNGHRVLVFSQMVRCLDILEDYLMYRKYPFERIDGRIRGNLRQAAIDRYCKPDSDRFVFLLCTKAGGLGINLTAADTVIIYDSDWNPQNDLQAQARCHRIGQQKMVKVYRLLCRSTYEREMFDKASLKLGLDRAVLQSMNTAQGGKDPAGVGGNQKQLSKKEIEDLLKKGAYGAIMEEDNAGDKFCEEDIEQILERRTQIITLETGEKGSTFSKASFACSGNRSDIDIDDPDFWKKWAKKAEIDLDDGGEKNELVISEPRRRTQIKRYGHDESMVDMSELDSSSDSDDEGSNGLGRGRGRRSQRSSKFGRRPRSLNKFYGDDHIPRDGEIVYGSWARSECFKVEKGLLTFGWGRWPEILSQGQFRRGWRECDVEDCARVILLYCLRYYHGDDKIKGFIWDLITPTENGESRVQRNHMGLSAPVPRGRKGKKKMKEARMLNAMMEVNDWSRNEKYDGDIFLECNYKKHLTRHANKVLLRVRMLYYIKHEIIGDLVQQIADGVPVKMLEIYPPYCDSPPAPWWDTEADKSLLAGTFKHGYERYREIRADPTLSFLAQVGPPPPLPEDPISCSTPSSPPRDTTTTNTTPRQRQQPNANSSNLDEDKISEDEDECMAIEGPGVGPQGGMPGNSMAEGTGGGPGGSSLSHNPIHEHHHTPEEAMMRYQHANTSNAPPTSVAQSAPGQYSMSGMPGDRSQVMVQEQHNQMMHQLSEAQSQQQNQNDTENQGTGGSWPSVADLNTRLRRVITSYQRNYKKEEMKMAQKAKTPITVTPTMPDCRQRWPQKVERSKVEQMVRDREKARLEMNQRRWSRKEEADFYRTVSTFGVEYDRKRGRYDWNRFRAISHLERKFDESMTEYYKAFLAMCKRSCGLKLMEDEVNYPDMPLEPLPEDKARRTLERIELLRRVREDILSHPRLGERLTLCRPSPELPDWWMCGRHDRELLLGTAKHGLGRTDFYILNDPELSFREFVRESCNVQKEIPVVEEIAKDVDGSCKTNESSKPREEEQPKPLVVAAPGDLLQMDGDAMIVKLEKGEGTLKIERIGVKKEAPPSNSMEEEISEEVPPPKDAAGGKNEGEKENPSNVLVKEEATSSVSEALEGKEDNIGAVAEGESKEKTEEDGKDTHEGKDEKEASAESEIRVQGEENEVMEVDEGSGKDGSEKVTIKEEKMDVEEAGEVKAEGETEMEASDVKSECVTLKEEGVIEGGKAGEVKEEQVVKEEAGEEKWTGVDVGKVDLLGAEDCKISVKEECEVKTEGGELVKEEETEEKVSGVESSDVPKEGYEEKAIAEDAPKSATAGDVSKPEEAEVEEKAMEEEKTTEEGNVTEVKTMEESVEEVRKLNVNDKDEEVAEVQSASDSEKVSKDSEKEREKDSGETAVVEEEKVGAEALVVGGTPVEAKDEGETVEGDKVSDAEKSANVDSSEKTTECENVEENKKDEENLEVITKDNEEEIETVKAPSEEKEALEGTSPKISSEKIVDIVAETKGIEPVVTENDKEKATGVNVVEPEVTKMAEVSKDENLAALENEVQIIPADQIIESSMPQRNASLWPKDRVLQTRLEHIVHAVEHGEWPSSTNVGPSTLLPMHSQAQMTNPTQSNIMAMGSSMARLVGGLLGALGSLGTAATRAGPGKVPSMDGVMGSECGRNMSEVGMKGSMQSALPSSEVVTITTTTADHVTLAPIVPRQRPSQPVPQSLLPPALGNMGVRRANELHVGRVPPSSASPSPAVHQQHSVGNLAPPPSKKRKRHIAIDVETERAKLHALLNSTANQTQSSQKLQSSLWGNEEEPSTVDSGTRRMQGNMQPPPAHQQQGSTRVLSMPLSSYDLGKYHPTNQQPSSSPSQDQQSNTSGSSGAPIVKSIGPTTLIPGTSSTLTPIDLSSGLPKMEGSAKDSSEVQDFSMSSRNKQKSKLDDMLDKLMKRKVCVEEPAGKEKKRRKLDEIVLGLSAAREQSLFSEVKKSGTSITPIPMSASHNAPQGAGHKGRHGAMSPQQQSNTKPFTITVTSVPPSQSRPPPQSVHGQPSKPQRLPVPGRAHMGSSQHHSSASPSSHPMQQQQQQQQQQHRMAPSPQLRSSQSTSQMPQAQQQQSQRKNVYESMLADLGRVADFSRLGGSYSHEAKISGNKAPQLKRLGAWLVENPMFDIDPKWADLVKERGNLPRDLQKRLPQGISVGAAPSVSTSSAMGGDQRKKGPGRPMGSHAGQVGSHSQCPTSSSGHSYPTSSAPSPVTSTPSMSSLAAGLSSLSPALLSGLGLGAFDPKNNPLLMPFGGGSGSNSAPAGSIPGLGAMGGLAGLGGLSGVSNLSLANSLFANLAGLNLPSMDTSQAEGSSRGSGSGKSRKAEASKSMSNPNIPTSSAFPFFFPNPSLLYTPLGLGGLNPFSMQPGMSPAYDSLAQQCGLLNGVSTSSATPTSNTSTLTAAGRPMASQSNRGRPSLASNHRHRAREAKEALEKQQRHLQRLLSAQGLFQQGINIEPVLNEGLEQSLGRNGEPSSKAEHESSEERTGKQQGGVDGDREASDDCVGESSASMQSGRRLRLSHSSMGSGSGMGGSAAKRPRPARLEDAVSKLKESVVERKGISSSGGKGASSEASEGAETPSHLSPPSASAEEDGGAEA